MQNNVCYVRYVTLLHIIIGITLHPVLVQVMYRHNMQSDFLVVLVLNSKLRVGM